MISRPYGPGLIEAPAGRRRRGRGPRRFPGPMGRASLKRPGRAVVPQRIFDFPALWAGPH